jgi:hypothetical protein
MTPKAKRTSELKSIYFSEVLPRVLTRNPYCQRCHVAKSVHAHHRKGNKGFQEGIPLMIYEDLLMAVCNECHTYIHKNPQESYNEHWMYHRNRGELPKGWQDSDYVLHPELREVTL